MKTKLIACFIATALVLFAAGVVKCPIDKSTMTFTGKTKSDFGKLLYEYRCPSGHTGWVVQ